MNIEDDECGQSEAGLGGPLAGCQAGRRQLTCLAGRPPADVLAVAWPPVGRMKMVGTNLILIFIFDRFEFILMVITIIFNFFFCF
jgi:hypothetical protein